MPKKKQLAKDKGLKDLLKSGGRDHAEADFNELLKKAAKPKTQKPSKKPRAKN